MEAGGASAILAITEYGGVPLAKTQKELTPLQRMVIQLEAERQHEEAEKGSGGPSGASGGTGQVMNSRSLPGGGGSGETITYVNDGVDNG